MGTDGHEQQGVVEDAVHHETDDVEVPNPASTVRQKSCRRPQHASGQRPPSHKTGVWSPLLRMPTIRISRLIDPDHGLFGHELFAYGKERATLGPSLPNADATRLVTALLAKTQKSDFRFLLHAHNSRLIKTRSTQLYTDLRQMK